MHTRAARNGDVPDLEAGRRARAVALAGARLGYWSAIATFLAAAGYGVVQLLQLAGTLTFPRDEILIFGFSIAIPFPFVVALIALHRAVDEPRRVWTQCAIAFGIMYATLVTVVYPTQLALVVPARLAGRFDDVQFLMVSQGTFMWVIDGAGYILMGLATLFAAGALAGVPETKWLRVFLVANGVLDPIIVAIYVYPSLLLVGSLWLLTAPGSMLLLARFFRSVRA